jgi:hypothetical protein
MQSKDLCIFLGAREKHGKHLVANLIRKMRAPNKDCNSHSQNAGTHRVEQAFRPALKLREEFGFSH